jgi:hypothetical protein
MNHSTLATCDHAYRIAAEERNPIFYQKNVDWYESKKHILRKISIDEQTYLNFRKGQQIYVLIEGI